MEDQPSYNYDYDEIGNLSFDANGGLLHNISWSNAQKLRLITSAGDNMTYEFRYNPMQQRVAKLHRYFNNEGVGETRTYYIRDAQGNVMATYRGWGQYEEEGVVTWDSFALAEQHIYGSARVGMAAPELMLYPAVPINPHALDSCRYRIFEGWKRYEITNHLGNVLAVITDRKRGQGSSGDIEWFAADVMATQQYYPFGMLMPGDTSANVRRQYSLGGADYRYGFNKQEKDKEIAEQGNSYDFEFRHYDPRLGRFKSIDPLTSKYPGWTPYAFAQNRPIDGIDLEGLEFLSVNNSGINPNRHVSGLDNNGNNLYSFNLGEQQFNAIPMVTLGGEFYFNIEQNLFYGDNGWSNSSENEDSKMTVDVAAAPYLFSEEGMQGLIDRANTFSQTTDLQKLPAGSTGWCLTWLHQECVELYGGRASQYGDRITAAMETVATIGSASEMTTQYGLNARGRQIFSSGADPGNKPNVSSFSPGIGQSLVDQIGNSPGIFLFALSPGNGIHCTFTILNNRDIQNRQFIVLHNHGVRPLDAENLDSFYIDHTNYSINRYGAKNWNVGLRKWQLKEKE